MVLVFVAGAQWMDKIMLVNLYKKSRKNPFRVFISDFYYYLKVKILTMIVIECDLIICLDIYCDENAPFIIIRVPAK